MRSRSTKRFSSSSTINTELAIAASSVSVNFATGSGSPVSPSIVPTPQRVHRPLLRLVLVRGPPQSLPLSPQSLYHRVFRRGNSIMPVTASESTGSQWLLRCQRLDRQRDEPDKSQGAPS